MTSDKRMLTVDRIAQAWLTDGMGIVSIVFAQSRSRARAATVRSANDAGYALEYLAVRAVRAPEYDRFADRYTHNRCWSVDWIDNQRGVWMNDDE